MKFLTWIFALSFSAAALAEPNSYGASAHYSVTCVGNIGMHEVNKTMLFGNANPSLQEFAYYNRVSYAIQLSSYKGFVDILLMMNTKDTQTGEVLYTSYIRSHGGTELDLVDKDKDITLICTLLPPGPPPPPTAVEN